MDNSGVAEMSIINAIIPGKNEINVSGVKALWASLNVFEVLAMEMHNPLINIEYAIIINNPTTILDALYIVFASS